MTTKSGTEFSVLSLDEEEPQSLIAGGSEADVVEALQNYEPSTVTIQEWEGEELISQVNGADWLIDRPCPLCGNTLER